MWQASCPSSGSAAVPRSPPGGPGATRAPRADRPGGYTPAWRLHIYLPLHIRRPPTYPRATDTHRNAYIGGCARRGVSPIVGRIVPGWSRVLRGPRAARRGLLGMEPRLLRAAGGGWPGGPW